MPGESIPVSCGEPWILECGASGASEKVSEVVERLMAPACQELRGSAILLPGEAPREETLNFCSCFGCRGCPGVRLCLASFCMA